MTSSNWSQKKLSDIANVTMGQSPKGIDCNNEKQGMPLLNGPTEFGNYHPHPTQYTTDPKKISKEGDLLFCVRGSTTGRMNWSDQAYAIGRGIAAISPIDNSSDRFIKAAIDYNLPKILKMATGSTFPNVGSSLLNDLKILAPRLKEIQKINNVFKYIEDKIEVNNKINENLEEQAQVIFKHWFVDFEFPDKNGSPYKSSGGKMVESELGMIPKAWKVVKCGDKFNFVKGKVPKYADNLSESAMPYLNKSALDGNWEDIRYGYKDTGVYCEPLDVLMMMDGSSSSDIFYGYEGLVGSTLSLIDAKDDNVREVLYMYFKIFNNELKNQNTGSAIPHANKDFINNIKLAIPKLDREFSEISIFFKNIRIQVLSNRQQNEKLAQLRDTLLPKLMSGEIRIPLD